MWIRGNRKLLFDNCQPLMNLIISSDISGVGKECSFVRTFMISRWKGTYTVDKIGHH